VLLNGPAGQEVDTRADQVPNEVVKANAVARTGVAYFVAHTVATNVAPSVRVVSQLQSGL